jgi:hypothetical protein
MKQIVATLILCIYFNCCGAASSHQQDAAYVAFTDGKKSQQIVIDTLSPLIQLPCHLPHQWAFTSVGTHQLFGCFVAGAKLGYDRTAHEIVHTMRSYWDLRIGDDAYLQYRQAGCRHIPYPLMLEDINRALKILNGVRFTPDDVDIVCLDASSEGVRLFFSNKILVPEYESPEVFNVAIPGIGRLRVNKASIIAYFKSLHGDLSAGDKRMSHNAIDYVELYSVKNLICTPGISWSRHRS